MVAKLPKSADLNGTWVCTAGDPLYEVGRHFRIQQIEKYFIYNMFTPQGEVQLAIGQFFNNSEIDAVWNYHNDDPNLEGQERGTVVFDPNGTVTEIHWEGGAIFHRFTP